MMQDTLAKNTNVRFFKGDLERRESYRQLYPGTWESDSHFIRAACIHFMAFLDRQPPNTWTDKEGRKMILNRVRDFLDKLEREE